MTIIEAPRDLDVVDEEGAEHADATEVDGAAVLDLAPAPPADDTVVQGSEDGHGVDPAYVVDGHAVVDGPDGPAAEPEPVDGTLTDAAYLVEDTGPDGPPVDTAPPGSLAAAVADHLAGRVPEPDERGEAALAVLDVLRASGWSDTGETQALQAEVTRLRELLDLVVRDHRARVASDASGHAEQAHWLVPLLRAAHGVSFGTLGAKVHLRTAMHDIPQEVLGAAGLRIEDSGPIPEQDHRWGDAGESATVR